MPSPPPFDRRSLITGLAALPVLAGPSRGQQAPVRTLAAMPGEARLQGPDHPATAILGYDGLVPGPVLRARRGEEFRLRLANGLDQPTALHFHGMRLANAMDGAAGLTQEAVAPGATFDIAFTPQDAGTFLYRPWHPAHGASQVTRGLAGLMIVEGPTLPTADREQILVLGEWALDDKGALAAAGTALEPQGRPGTAGRIVTVNGQPDFTIEARANERLWLRIANAAHARIMQVVVPGQPLTLVALDGQPCEPFLLQNAQVTLGPGQRAEIMLDVTGAPGSSVPIAINNLQGAALEGLLKVADGAPLRPSPLPRPDWLDPNPIAQDMDFRRAFRLDLGIEAKGTDTVFNGKPDRAPARDPAFRVRRGTVVMAGLRNQTQGFHAVHLHGHQARLLDGLDDGWKPFFLDTILVAPGTTARIAFLADNPGKWVIEAQAIGDDRGPLVQWFEVT
ncbi:MAG: multicopper oxidase family protein [Piscinibacter sp.]